jgi:hypothetical protein
VGPGPSLCMAVCPLTLLSAGILSDSRCR